MKIIDFLVQNNLWSIGDCFFYCLKNNYDIDQMTKLFKEVHELKDMKVLNIVNDQFEYNLEA